jgi:hypothetical protein
MQTHNRLDIGIASELTLLAMTGQERRKPR